MDVGTFAAMVVMAALYGGPPQASSGQADVGFMWYRFPNGNCFRVDTSHYKDIPKSETWMDAYELGEMTRQYFVLKGWILKVDSTHPMCAAKQWTSTQGLYALTAAPPVVVQPPPVTTITAPTGTLTDATGGTWTFGTQTASGGNSLLLNGMPTSGFGKTLQLSNGKVYTSTADGRSFVWTGTNWVTGAP